MVKHGIPKVFYFFILLEIKQVHIEISSHYYLFL